MRISDWSSDGCSSDLHPRLLERQQLRRLRRAGHAPACEDVEQARLARRQLRACQRRPVARGGGQGEGGQRLADQLRTDDPVVRAQQPAREQPEKAEEQGQRQPDQHLPHAAASKALRARHLSSHPRRSRPTSASAPPRAIRKPPSQINVAKGFHQMRSCHRSEEHTSELQSLMHISYAVFCLKKKITSHARTQYVCSKNSNT